MIDYSCSKCGFTMSSPTEMVGQKEVCPFCGSETIVPASHHAKSSPTLPPPLPPSDKKQHIFSTPKYQNSGQRKTNTLVNWAKKTGSSLIHLPGFVRMSAFCLISIGVLEVILLAIELDNHAFYNVTSQIRGILLTFGAVVISIFPVKHILQRKPFIRGEILCVVGILVLFYIVMFRPFLKQMSVPPNPMIGEIHDWAIAVLFLRIGEIVPLVILFIVACKRDLVEYVHGRLEDIRQPLTTRPDRPLSTFLRLNLREIALLIVVLGQIVIMGGMIVLYLNTNNPNPHENTITYVFPSADGVGQPHRLGFFGICWSKPEYFVLGIVVILFGSGLCVFSWILYRKVFGISRKVNSC